ncbi:amidase signature domain-containing protein [Aspergillus filifer]
MPTATTDKWRTIAARKQEKREKAIQSWKLICELLSTRELEITELPPQYTAEEILKASVNRSIIAHHLANPLTEIMFARGLSRARELDEIMARTGKPIGPLHGLPISLKDKFNIAGEETSMGTVALAEHTLDVTDPIVQRLEAAGAVLYVKTNIPQTGLSGECNNFAFSRTPTPWNTTLSVGGPLGIGSDVLGSIRTPANFNGIYGLCPTSGRFPGHGAYRSRGLTLISGVFGPLARSVDGLELYTRTMLILTHGNGTPHAIISPGDRITTKNLPRDRKLRVSIVEHDGVVIPHPPIRRCLREAMPRSGRCSTRSPSRSFRRLSCLHHGMSSVSRSTRIAQPILSKCVRNTFDIWIDTAKPTASGEAIDVIVLPSGGHVAPLHSTLEYFAYELYSNVLDWPCATIPVGFVDPTLDPAVDDLEIPPLSEMDRRNREKWSLEAYKDAPVADVAPVGRRCREGDHARGIDTSDCLGPWDEFIVY